MKKIIIEVHFHLGSEPMKYNFLPLSYNRTFIRTGQISFFSESVRVPSITIAKCLPKK